MRKILPAMLMVLLMIFSTLIIISEEADSKKETPSGSGGYSYVDGNDPDPKVECNFVDIRFDNDAKGYSPDSYNDFVDLDLPFSFPYYGSSYDKAYASTYMALSFNRNSAQNIGSPYNHRSIPKTEEPNTLLAVYWGPDYAFDWSNQDKQTIFTLHTTENDVPVFIIQWEGRQGTLCQALLYKGGMIKFQYQSVYVYSNNGVGSRTIIGIENSQGTQGIGYSDYDSVPSGEDIFTAPFAIAFVKEEIMVYDTELENGDGTNGRVVNAGSDYYRFKTRISHSDGALAIKTVNLRLSPHKEKIDFTYFSKNDTFIQRSGLSFATLHREGSVSDTIGENSIEVTFSVDFKLSYPSEEPRNVTLIAAGLAAVPAVNEVEDLYRVENDLEWNMKTVYSETQGGRRLSEGAWVGGGETIIFSGLKIVYEGSDEQPRPSLAQVKVSDNYETKKTVFIPIGEAMEVPWNTVQVSAQMQFRFSMDNVGYANKVPDSSENFTYTLTVDTIAPETVNDIVTYADGIKEDEISPFDNDRDMYVQWKNASDGAMSGVEKYLVEARSGDFTLKKEVPQSQWSRNTYNSINLGWRISESLPEGRVNISIRAIDLVGNIGDPSHVIFMVDLQGPTYEMLDPEPGEWVKSKTPELTFRVKDELSGVTGSDLYFRESRDGGISWNDWELVREYKSGKEIEFEIEPNLVEGRNNRIEMKGQDKAVSEETTSEPFEVWVDARPPKIEISGHEVDENNNITDWLERPKESVTFKIHDWKGSGLDMDQIFYRFSSDNGTSFSADTPLVSQPYNNTNGYQEIEVDISKNWVEGKENILEIEASDEVGRKSIKRFRVKLDTTPEFVIVKPISGRRYLDNESVPFEVRYSDQDGEEDIEITWISSIDGILPSSKAEDNIMLSAGDHTITLVLEDSVHTIRRSFPLNVLDHIMEMPSNKDSDNDGMNDSYEMEHGFDPERKDGDQDYDEDGYTNLEEYYAGTDPKLAKEYPGSSTYEEKFPIGTLILMVVGIILLMVSAVILIMELRKQPENTYLAPPPPPMTYLNQASQATLETEPKPR